MRRGLRSSKNQPKLGDNRSIATGLKSKRRLRPSMQLGCNSCRKSGKANWNRFTPRSNRRKLWVISSFPNGLRLPWRTGPHPRNLLKPRNSANWTSTSVRWGLRPLSKQAWSCLVPRNSHSRFVLPIPTKAQSCSKPPTQATNKPSKRLTMSFCACFRPRRPVD